MLQFEPYINTLPNFLAAFLFGLVLTPFLIKIGLRFGFSTKPRSQLDPNERGYVTRLDNDKTYPRLGEFAMVIPLLLLMWRDLNLTTPIFGIVISIAMVSIFGAMDSKYQLSEFVKLFILTFASLILIFTGTVIDIHTIIPLQSIDYSINNPITGTELSLLSVFVTYVWLLVIPTALSYVGGVDGLSEGTSAIAILILTLIAIRTGDTMTIVIGTLCFGGLLGFLPFNFYPKAIMSEHLIYGYVIAILAILSKGKITTSILILTVPLVDFIYVTGRRALNYLKENSGKGFSLRMLLHRMGTGDKTHLHHRLLELGWGHARISITQYVVYGILGCISLVVTGLYLTLAILGSIAFIVLMFYYINRKIHYGKR